jgi:hypothetical protein
MPTIELTEELLEAFAEIAAGSVVEDPETDPAAAIAALPTDEAEFAAPPSVEP